MNVVCGGVGESDADVVDGGCRGFGVAFAVGGWGDVGFVDANGVVEFDGRQGAEVWLEDVW